MSDPHLPTRLDALDAAPVGDESALLWRARRAGIAVAPIVLVPVVVEADHYRLNNLPVRLDALFTGVAREDPDEDDLEELAPEAEAMVRGAALLDEVVERFYDALAGLPDRLEVRRDGARGVVVGTRRDALLALKRRWSDEWAADAMLARARSGAWAPESRPVLVHAADLHAGRIDLSAVGEPAADAWLDRDGRVARIELEARGDR